MKKIYTMIGQQKLSKSFYGDANGECFSNCKQSVYFPVTAYLSSLVDSKESFKVLVVDSFKTKESHDNIALLSKELQEKYHGQCTISTIEADFENHQKGQVTTFKKIYKTFESGDEIYFDITFGLKPTPMTVFVSCNYAQKFIKDISIKSMVYAYYNFQADESHVHPIINITSLFLLNNLIDTLSDMQSGDPTKFIDSIFKTDESCE